MTKRLRCLAFAAALLAFVPERDAAASSMVELDLAALASGADQIVLGSVEKVESHYAAPASRVIVTDATIVTERRVLGAAAGSRFVVRRLGGEVGKVGQRVFGEASYQVGEHVLLFAVARGGSYWALGMAQGVLHAYRDDAGVTRVATDLAGVELQRGPAAGGARVANGYALDDVLAQVRALLLRRGGPSQ